MPDQVEATWKALGHPPRLRFIQEHRFDRDSRGLDHWSFCRKAGVLYLITITGLGILNLLVAREALNLGLLPSAVTLFIGLPFMGALFYVFRERQSGVKRSNVAGLGDQTRSDLGSVGGLPEGNSVSFNLRVLQRMDDLGVPLVGRHGELENILRVGAEHRLLLDSLKPLCLADDGSDKLRLDQALVLLRVIGPLYGIKSRQLSFLESIVTAQSIGEDTIAACEAVDREVTSGL